ncbi:MAG: HigA family addiction module antidote protein [Microbacteriaceae bacterium]|nr:HigA family addiction module antidote protein [Microbacteriaceae bacterium]
MSGRELALNLEVTASTISRVLKGESRVTPEMALRLSKVLGRSAESWLAMQDSYDLDLAKKTINLDDVSVIEFARKKKSLNLFADKNITV